VTGVLIVITIAVIAARHHSIVDRIPFFITLLVTAVPVALPAMLTITMALGSNQLSKRSKSLSFVLCVSLSQSLCLSLPLSLYLSLSSCRSLTHLCPVLMCFAEVLVARLNATEDAARMTVLCSDKTVSPSLRSPFRLRLSFSSS
jgi:magnesium-transporting ATPase (P-type)